MTSEDDFLNRYIHYATFDVELGGAPYKTTVHLGVIEGRVGCVGLDIRAFEERFIGEEITLETGEVVEGGTATTVVGLEGWQALTARRLRDLRLTELTDQARLAIQALIQEALEYRGVVWTAEETQETYRTWDLLEPDSRESRPGRPPTIDPVQLLGVVVPVYREHVALGGRSPVRAVRDALDGSGVIDGAGAAGEVTMGQARAAVRRARQMGLLDPASPEEPDATEENA